MVGDWPTTPGALARVRGVLSRSVITKPGAPANGRHEGPCQNPAALPGTRATSRQFRRFHATQPTAAVNVVATMSPPTTEKTAEEAVSLPSHTAKPEPIHIRPTPAQVAPTQRYSGRPSLVILRQVI